MHVELQHARKDHLGIYMYDHAYICQKSSLAPPYPS